MRSNKARTVTDLTHISMRNRRGPASKVRDMEKNGIGTGEDGP